MQIRFCSFLLIEVHYRSVLKQGALFALRWVQEIGQMGDHETTKSHLAVVSVTIKVLSVCSFKKLFNLSTFIFLERYNFIAVFLLTFRNRKRVTAAHSRERNGTSHQCWV